MTINGWALALFMVGVAAGRAAAADPPSLEHVGVVDAPIDQVWDAFTTSEGLRGWMAPHADIDLALSGKMRTNFDAQAALGGPGTIENTVLAFEPKRMIAFKVSHVPEGFPFVNAIKSMWTVVYFDSIDAGHTRVRQVSLGFGGDDESQRMRAFFDQADAQLLQALQRRFSRTP